MFANKRILEFDILKDNNITLILDDNTVSVDTEFFQNVNFVKMQILTSALITNVDNLRAFIKKHPNFEVMIKQINMEKLGVGIITPFKDIKFMNEDDVYIDKIKRDEPVRTLLGLESIYDEQNNLVFTMELHRNYLESEDTYEYIINVKYDQYDISLVYGDVNNRKLVIDFNKYDDASFYIISPNGVPHDMNIDSYDDYAIPEPVKNIIRLINAQSVELAFGHLL